MAEKVTGWGKRIKAARIDQGLSQTALAERLGKSRPTIASWEEESTSPDLAEVPSIARALRVPASWLVFGQGLAA